MTPKSKVLSRVFLRNLVREISGGEHQRSRSLGEESWLPAKSTCLCVGHTQSTRCNCIHLPHRSAIRRLQSTGMINRYNSYRHRYYCNWESIRLRLRYRQSHPLSRKGRHFARLFIASKKQTQRLGRREEERAEPPSNERVPHLADCCNSLKAPSH